MPQDASVPFVPSMVCDQYPRLFLSPRIRNYGRTTQEPVRDCTGYPNLLRTKAQRNGVLVAPYLPLHNIFVDPESLIPHSRYLQEFQRRVTDSLRQWGIRAFPEMGST